MYPPGPYKLKTEKGLKFLFIGLLLYVLFQIIYAGFIYIYSAAIIDFQQATASSDTDAISEHIGLLGAICGAAAFQFFVLIIVLLGLIYYFSARAEFGKEHSINVEYGFMFLIVGFVLSVIGVTLASTAQSGLESLIIIVSVITILSSIYYGVGFFDLLEFLLDNEGLKYLKIGVIFLIITRIVYSTLLLLIWQNPELFGNNETNILISFGLNEVSTIPWAIFTFSIYSAWKRVRRGVIKPDLKMYPTPVPGPDVERSHISKKCPACDYIIEQKQKECPRCGYYLENE